MDNNTFLDREPIVVREYLTDAQVEDLRRELSDAMRADRRLVIRQKRYAGMLKERRAALQKTIAECVDNIDRGYNDVERVCAKYVDYSTQRISYVDETTGAVVYERQMRAAERQQTIPFPTLMTGTDHGVQ